MDQYLNNDSLRENDTSIKVSIKETKKGNTIHESSLANVKATMREKNNREKSNKCNQCDYASSQARKLRTHLKTHSGEIKDLGCPAEALKDCNHLHKL